MQQMNISVIGSSVHSLHDSDPLSTLPKHANFDPDLYSHILRLRGSNLSPGWLLVVVHLVAHGLLPVDGFGLGRKRGNVGGMKGRRE